MIAKREKHPRQYECVVMFEGHEFQCSAEGRRIPTAHWEVTRTISLPFVPRKGMRLGNLIQIPAKDIIWSAADPKRDVVDDEWGYRVAFVTWDVANARFLLRIFDVELSLPAASTPETLADLYPGWTFSRTVDYQASRAHFVKHDSN